jgi:hypothetical protein
VTRQITETEQRSQLVHRPAPLLDRSQFSGCYSGFFFLNE